MALVHFRLYHRRQEAIIETAVLRLQYLCEDGKYYYEPIKERINVKHWRSDAERMIASAKSAGTINKLLDNRQEAIEAAARRLRGRGEAVTPSALKREIRGYSDDFWSTFEMFLQDPPESVGKSTVRMYRLIYDNLKAYEKERGQRIGFQTFGVEFNNDFTRFLRKQGYADSTISTGFGKISGILSYAKSKKIIQGFDPVSTVATNIDHGAVYLNPAEIKMMLAVVHAYHLPGRKDRVETMRKAGYYFVLGTQLGIRAIDFDISAGHSEGNRRYLNISNRKTTTTVLIPISSIARAILSLFNWEVKAMNRETVRHLLPVIAKFAGITEPTIYRQTVNGVIVETTVPKYEMVSPHTMRRSWATNLLNDGANPLDVMKAGGWKTWDSFQKYIRMSEKDVADRLGKIMK